MTVFKLMTWTRNFRNRAAGARVSLEEVGLWPVPKDREVINRPNGKRRNI